MSDDVADRLARLEAMLINAQISGAVLVALNAKGEERAMLNLAEPWPIGEFLEVIRGWAEVPERRITIRKGGV